LLATKQAAGQYATGTGNAAGTNTGDNAANSTYANDYRAANFIAATHYLSPTGNGSQLTGLTAAQVGHGNVDNTSDATKNAAAVVLTNKTIGTFNYAADAGANDSYVISLSPAPVSYTTGMMIVFKANTQNTTGCTINVNSLGVKTIVKRVNTTPATGDILASMLCWLVYDGTNFVLLNPVVN
ncbi:MAG TPA: hypothetical protein VM187_12855, partial [Niastella sp.]|nr:hypothetical protein [Niastella sp.]